jgi:NADPH:quinone reductase-like Zn-dependent oxidoreductase
MSQSLLIKKQAGMIQVGRNVFLNSQGKLSNGTSSLTLSSAGIVLDGIITFPHSVITQTTSQTADVIIDGSSGVIGTFASTLAAQSSIAFTVSNENVAADSVVLVSISDYSGEHSTNGIPAVAVKSVVEGGFDVVLTNTHGANALDGTLKIAFLAV